MEPHQHSHIHSQYLVCFLLALAVTTLLTTTARGDLALDFVGESGNLFTANSSFGWSFEVNHPVRVDQLGFFDDFSVGGPGLNHDHLVRLWTDDQDRQLLAAATVTNASTPVATTAAQGQWLFEPITPILLTPGDYVISADDPACNTDCDQIRFITSATTQSAITLGTVRNSSPPGFPQATSPNRDDGYFGPNFRVIPLPGPDLNLDDRITCADVDALVAEIVAATHSASFDMTGDGMVDADDLSEWRVQAGAVQLASSEPYPVGDANLDGAVDGQDFIIWNSNKFSSVAAWCSADFTANGVVDGADFVLWNANKFTSADQLPAAVPEPEAALLMLAALAGLASAGRLN